MGEFIRASRIYCEDGMKEGVLKLENGRFAGIYSEIPKGSKSIDYSNYSIIPGIFDTHNHGAMGYSVKKRKTKDHTEEIRGYLKALPAHGVTMVFPTVMDDFGYESIAQVAEEKLQGAIVAGIHSEGPFLNRVGEKGRPKPYPKISLDKVKDMIGKSGGKLRLFALAPEIQDSQKIIQYLTKHNITVAIAHSNCNGMMTRKAIEDGISVATHLGNVMTGIHHRDIGVLGVCLLDDRIDCELICDGFHICNDMLQIILKLKDPSRIMMISDGTPFSGAPIGRYAGESEGSVLNVERDGRILDEDGKISGSSKTVLDGIRNLVENLHIPLEEVLPMASLNPCRKYGFENIKGSIALGKDADFVVIDEGFEVVATYIMGEKVYSAEQKSELFNPDFIELNKLL
ncbi:MAG: amidohydrolase family protein [Thermotaleaceae bacterium]